MGSSDSVSKQTKAPAMGRAMAGARVVYLQSGPQGMWPIRVRDSASQKQLAVLIECLPENDPGLAQILVHLCFVHSHRPSNCLRVEDRPSAPLAFPRVRVARCSKGVLLERMIGTKRTNALKGCPYRWPQLGKAHHLLQQFPCDDLLLNFIPRSSFRDRESREIGCRADAVVLPSPEIVANGSPRHSPQQIAPKSIVLRLQD